MRKSFDDFFDIECARCSLIAFYFNNLNVFEKEVHCSTHLLVFEFRNFLRIKSLRLKCG